MQINPAGKPIVKGSASLPGIPDGTSKTILVAETRGASASCADAGDSGTEINDLVIPFRFDRSSERVSAAIEFSDPIVDDGDYAATLDFGRDLGRYVVILSVDFDLSPQR